MGKLTPRQKAFADYYIETGNAEQSAIRAGYTKKSARGNATRLISNECISEYIAERQAAIDKDRLMTLEEIQEFRTRVIRGEEKDAFEMDAGLSDRLKAANDLEKALKIEKEREEKIKAMERDPWNLPITDITIDFVEPYRAVHEAFKTGKIREIISKGGRGSIKSNFWAGVAEETIYNDPQAHVVYTRRYKTDLRGSVYNQFMKTVIRHNKLDEWEFTTSPMMARLKRTGQCVIFVGCDKPISLKSYNLSFGYVKLLIHEECDEMAGVEQMDNVEDTFLRNDINSIDVKVFNPPKSANNFMNEYTLECMSKEGTLVCHSYYYNVPEKWLGKRFFDRAEWFKEHKPKYYENNYLGQVTGTGGTIFENLEIRTITDKEIESMGTLYHGLDFGYEHPQAFTETSYDRENDILYILNEEVHQRMKQSTFARRISKYKNVEIIADSASPDKIADYSDWGFDIVGATKRWKGGGRDYAWEWLQQRRKIVIDPDRTPKALKEFKTAEHELLKDGSFSSKYPDLGEDAIMSVIYGLNRVIMEEKILYDDYEDYEDDEYDTDY